MSNITEVLVEYAKELETLGKMEENQRQKIKQYEKKLTFEISGVRFKIMAHHVKGTGTDSFVFKPCLCINGTILSPDETKKLIQKLLFIFKDL